MSKLMDRLVEAMLKGLEDVADEIFTLSQRDVPVDKATLKKSGLVRRITNGWEVVYRAPHAAVNEFGYDAHEQQVRRHPVRAHYRRRFRGRKLSPRRKISVKAHYRGPFERHMSARAGRHYLGRSVESVRPRMGRILGRRLAREFARG